MTDRLGRLRDVAAALGAAAAIVGHPTNRHYFSGYPAGDHAPDESAGVMLVTSDAAVLYTSPTNLPWASAAVRPPVVARPWGRPWQDFLGTELQALDIDRVAFEDRAMTVSDHAAISANAGNIELIPAGGAFHAVRAIKDGQELSAISEAARITDAAFTAATAGLQAGVTERELAWRIDQAMRELGSQDPAFPTCVAAGLHGARPHHEPTDRRLERSEPVVIDMGARFDGYCGDLTRTIVIGEPSSVFIERYNVVLGAQQAALAGTRAGMTGREADAISRDAIAEAGYGDQFIHGLGHGVGLLIHEFPSLGQSSDDVLEPGHVITIEPGIYLDDWGGIRIEDLCVVNSNGLQVLSNAPK